MNGKRLRLMILTHGSHRAAAIIERILDLPCAEIAGIFIETAQSRAYTLPQKVKRSVRYDGLGGTLAKYARRLFKPRRAAAPDAGPSPSSQARIRDLASDHGIPLHVVAHYHLPEALDLMRSGDPDLGVVLGTNILKESVFSIPRFGSINTHQGLAPYYRGGPPVFWELFNDESEVGLTVHFVAAKVDTGDIIVQESVTLVYDYAAHGLDYEPFLAEMRDRLAERAAILVPQAIQMLADGTARPRPQNVELGKRYRLPVKREKDELRRRLRLRSRSANAAAANKWGVSN
jgi:folate-dependent phosphoribosylglycinamide formyltransferase PurN